LVRHGPRLDLVRHSSGFNIWLDQAGRSRWPNSSVLSTLCQAQHSGIKKNFIFLLQSSINSLPSKFKNPHLYPTSVDHLFLLLQNLFLRCGELEDLTYLVLPGLTVNQTNARHLANYTRLLKQLCTNVFQGMTNEKVQSNPHHITIYFTILCFHYNRYTRAVVHKDLGILIADFSNHWILHYAPLLAFNTNGTP